jgi:hypothetical protein
VCFTSNGVSAARWKKKRNKQTNKETNQQTNKREPRMKAARIYYAFTSTYSTPLTFFQLLSVKKFHFKKVYFFSSQLLFIFNPPESETPLMHT